MLRQRIKKVNFVLLQFCHLQQDLLNNTQTIGEILPSYTRNLSFRLTVRDNNAGGGGINYNSILFSVSSVAGPFLVTQPNTNVNWNSGSQTVSWNVANTNSDDVSVIDTNTNTLVEVGKPLRQSA